MSERGSPIGKSLIESLKSDSIDSLTRDYSEIAIDTLLKDGLLKDIPVVNTLVGLCKFGTTIRDTLFLEKVISFLTNLDRYSQDERAQFLKKLDQTELTDCTSAIALYLDRLDSMKKPPMLAKAFQAYMSGKITYKTMMYFCHFIDSVFIIVWQDYYDSIKPVAENKYHRPVIHLDDAQALEKVGFYKETHKPIQGINEKDLSFHLEKVERKLELTDIGILYIQVIFEFFQDPNDKFWVHQLEVPIDQT